MRRACAHQTYIWLIEKLAIRQQDSYAILRISQNRDGRENPRTMKAIILKTISSFSPSFRKPIRRAPSPWRPCLIGLIIACFALSPVAQAVVPAPDGGYAGGNTAEGQNALLSLTTGTYNTAVGLFSLLSNASNSFNTAIGAGTLLSNAASTSSLSPDGVPFGSENTATGAGGLLSNTTGGQNTANGAFALFNNVEGFRNTAIGALALFNNLGDSNTSIGPEALRENTVGDFNIAIGGSALISNTEGASNTAVGVGALSLNTTGDFNIVLGRGGSGISTGNNIIVIGQLSGESSAFGQVDDSCYIDNIFGADVDLGTVAIVGVDADGKLGTNAVDAAGNRVPVDSLVGGQRQAGLNLKVEALQATIAELKSTIAQQKKGMDALTAQLKEQAAQIQKVSTQLELNKQATQVVSYEQ
jgi:uncharacterized coiled-coil protein SlyX